MASFLQSTRPLAVTTPLGPDALLLTGFSGHEAISQPFVFQLEMLADNNQPVAFEKVLGQMVTVFLGLPGGQRRFFTGVCSQFGQGGRDQQLTTYRMELVPQFWLLTRSAQNRIFQNMNVPDILKKVLDGLDVSFQIQGTFQPREYCVQYRETDFNFACRLMEEEGIFYFFQHTDEGHTMVVANSPSSHPDLPQFPQITFDAHPDGNRPDDRIFAWEKFQELRSGKYELRDHCFELPGKPLEAVKTVQNDVQAGAVTHKLKVGGNDDMELYDWPGGYAQRFDGVDKGGGERPAELQKIFDDNKRTVGIRMLEETAPSLQIRGSSDCRQMISGHKFTLTRHFNADGPYLLTSIQHEVKLRGGFRSGGGQGVFYRNNFTCMPLALPYCPQRRTPRPMVQGTQTAVVVGPPGEEIFPDKYGRVKIQFHWDRQGKANLDSSCWVRVSQFWAGKKWGAMYIPRAGHEVLVDFLEGDPDQPIIIGSLYNAENMPFYELPKFKTLSYIKSDTTPGSKGFNELRFDDKKGKEQVFIHSQKRMDVRVLGSLYETTHGSRNEVIGLAKGTEPGGNHEVTIGGDNDIHIKGGRFEAVEKVENMSVKGVVVYDFQASHATMVKAKSELNAKEIILEAASKISLKVGGSCIVIDASGVTIAGAMVKINSGGYGTDTSNPGIDDPLDAETSDTGEPGFLDRPRPRGHGGRRHRTLNSQHAVSTPRAGEDPKMQRVRALLAATPTGRHALEVYDRNGITPVYNPANNGQWDTPNRVELGPPGKSDEQTALTMVHEMNHAQNDLEHTDADIQNQSRPDYINTQLAEDAHGERLAQQTAEEMTANGHPTTYNSSTAPSYNRGVAAERARNPSATPDELRAAGEQAMLNDYQNGTINTGNTTPPQSYVNYWGNAWDGAHPPAAGGGAGS